MRCAISMLPDEVLLAILDFHVAKYQDLEFIEALLSDYDTKPKIRSWQSLVHVCRPCPWITTSPETATLLYNQNSCEGDPGHLACLASPHSGQVSPKRHRETLDGNASAIPGARSSVPVI